jgi:hypothetical protein
MDKPLLLTEHRHEVMQVIRLVAKLRHLAKQHNIAFMMGPAPNAKRSKMDNFGGMSLHGSQTGRIYLNHGTIIESVERRAPRRVQFKILKARGVGPIKPQVFEIDLAKAEEQIMSWVVKNCPESIPKIVEE